MTAKKLPTVGTRVAVFQMDGVTWPGKDDGKPLHGVVTEQYERGQDPAWFAFYMLPDLPDLSQNDSDMDARSYDADRGWLVYNQHRWKRETFVINELELT